MSFEITITWAGAESFQQQARERSKRAEDFTPLTASLRSMFGEQFQNYFAIYPIGGRSNTLVESLTPPDILKADGPTVTVGTDVDYAPFYADYLRGQGRELIPFNEPIAEAFTTTILDWIMEGRN